MKTKLLIVLSAAMMLFTNLALAADINGKWTAEFKTQNGDTRTSTFTFKAEGDKLTGTVGSQMGEQQITNGKIDGNNVSFDVTMERNGNTMTMKYTGTVSGDELKLKRESPRGAQELTAKRATT